MNEVINRHGRSSSSTPASNIPTANRAERKPAFGILVLSALLAASQSAFAVTNLWSGAVDTNWSTPGNWTNNAPPGAGDDAIFDNTNSAANITTIGNVVDTNFSGTVS